MTTHVSIERDKHILQIRLNRPKKKNALTLAMYNIMSDAIQAAESDSSVRVIVFLGSGGNFTAGNDLQDFPEAPSSNEPTPVMRFISGLAQSTVPIIAGVEGLAVGIGATMLLHLDCVVTAPDARFLMPFINLALVPEAGSSYLLPQRLGYTRAAELLMRGKPFDGQRAFELGIASTLTDPGAVDDTALGIAAEFAQKPPQAMRKTKVLLKGDRQPLLDRIRWEEQLLFDCFATAENEEALAAMQEKRPPDFSTFS